MQHAGWLHRLRSFAGTRRPDFHARWHRQASVRACARETEWHPWRFRRPASASPRLALASASFGSAATHLTKQRNRVAMATAALQRQSELIFGVERTRIEFRWRVGIPRRHSRRHCSPHKPCPIRRQRAHCLEPTVRPRCSSAIAADTCCCISSATPRCRCAAANRGLSRIAS